MQCGFGSFDDLGDPAGALRPSSGTSRHRGRREFRFRMPSPEAELTELFEVFSSINEAWERCDKRAVSTMLINTVDTLSKRVFTWGLAAETTRRMIVIRWQIVPFRDRVRRGGAVGVSVLLADPGSPGSVSGRGSTTDGHSVR